VDLERHSDTSEIFARDGQHLVGHFKRSQRNRSWIRPFGGDADPSVIDFVESRANVGDCAFDGVVQRGICSGLLTTNT
jgi:hypothetical protein